MNNQWILKLWAVCMIFLTAVSVFVVLFEKRHLQEDLFTHIHATTYAIKAQVGVLPSDAGTEFMKETLDTFMQADPTALFYSLTNSDGTIILSDAEKRIGKKGIETAVINEITRPLYEARQREKNKKTPSRFVIYLSSLNEPIRGNEMVYDAFWDMSGNESRLGSLRMGFSRKELYSHLTIVAIVVFCSGFLLITGLLFFLIRSVKEREEFIGAFSEKRIAMEQMKKDLDQTEIEKKLIEKKLAEERKKIQQANRLILHREEERKQIESRMLNVQKLEAVGTLAGGIAHEFNNLFMAITGYASLIQKQSPPSHPNAKKADKILELVGVGSQSIKQLLGFARIGKYVQEALNINEVIRTTLDMFRKTRKDLVIDTACADGLWKVYADRSQMEQIVMNLLLNASEAMPSNGLIRIETRNIVLEKKQVSTDRIVSGRFVQFGIRDKGKGIKPEHLRRVFDPFFTTKHLSSGSGLGLASVYGIINNHDGFVTVESSAGKGTLFNIFLPAMKEDTILKDE